MVVIVSAMTAACSTVQQIVDRSRAQLGHDPCRVRNDRDLSSVVVIDGIAYDDEGVAGVVARSNDQHFRVDGFGSETAEFDGHRLRIHGYKNVMSKPIANGRLILVRRRSDDVFLYNEWCSIEAAALGAFALHIFDRRQDEQSIRDEQQKTRESFSSQFLPF